MNTPQQVTVKRNMGAEGAATTSAATSEWESWKNKNCVYRVGMASERLVELNPMELR